MSRWDGSWVTALVVCTLVGCGSQLGGNGEGGEGGGAMAGAAGTSVGEGGDGSGAGAGGNDAGAGPAGGSGGSSSGNAGTGGGFTESPPDFGYEYTEGCDRVLHPGRAVLTLFDDPALPFLPERVSGDGRVAAGSVGEAVGSWRATTGFVRYDASFRGSVADLDCAGEYAALYDTQNRVARYGPDSGITLVSWSVPTHRLPLDLAPSGGLLLFNTISQEWNLLQPQIFYDFEPQSVDDYRNTVLYNIGRDGFYVGVDALRVFYQNPGGGTLELALVTQTGAVPHLIVSDNDAVFATTLADGSILWGPLNPADPRRPRQRLLTSSEKPLALSAGGGVLLSSYPESQLWLEETYFTSDGGGFRDLTELAARFGADLARERLYAVDMSQDAQAFVGYTTRAGQRVGFHLTLPRQAYPQ